MRRDAEGLLHLAAAGIDGARRGFGCPVQRFVDAGALRRDGENDVLAGAGKTGLRLVGLAGERIGEFLAARLVGGLELVDLRAHQGGDALADLPTGSLEGLALHGDGLAHAQARGFETVRQILDPCADGFIGDPYRAFERARALRCRAARSRASTSAAGRRQASRGTRCPAPRSRRRPRGSVERAALQPRGAGREFVENAAALW